MTNWTKFRPTLLAAALLLVAGTAAQAQQPQQPPQPPQQPAATAASFSDAELKSFAQAQKKVNTIRTEITGKLQNTQDTAEAQKLQEEANARMLAAVEASGLTAEQYNKIAQAAMSDPALAEKLSQLQ